MKNDLYFENELKIIRYIVILGLGFFVMVMHSPSLLAEDDEGGWGRNPFAEQDVAEEEIADDGVGIEGLILKGVFIRGTTKKAIVSRYVVSEGDTFRGLTVAEIGSNYIMLKQETNTFKLKLGDTFAGLPDIRLPGSGEDDSVGDIDEVIDDEES